MKLERDESAEGLLVPVARVRCSGFIGFVIYWSFTSRCPKVAKTQIIHNKVRDSRSTTATAATLLQQSATLKHIYGASRVWDESPITPSTVNFQHRFPLLPTFYNFLLTCCLIPPHSNQPSIISHPYQLRPNAKGRMQRLPDADVAAFGKQDWDKSWPYTAQ